MIQWQLKSLDLELKYTWRISRGSIDRKTNYVIEVGDGDIVGIGESSGITGADPSLEEMMKSLEKIDLTGLQHAQEWTSDQGLSTRKRFAVESALVHYFAQKSGQSVSAYLECDPVEQVESSYSLPIMPPEDVEEFVHSRDLSRFHCLKIKTGHDHQKESIEHVFNAYKGPIRIDANEAFESARDVMEFVDQVQHLGDIQFIEQPISRDHDDDYLFLRKESPIPIVADESLQNGNIDQRLVDRFHGINVKLMKSGGYYQAIRQLKQARSQGMKTMLGCMVETSLGISSALNIAADVDWFDLDGFLYFKNDPFNLVHEADGIVLRASK